MIIIYNKFIPLKGFRAMNLCGILFARKEFEPLSVWTINHEQSTPPNNASGCILVSSFST